MNALPSAERARHPLLQAILVTGVALAAFSIGRMTPVPGLDPFALGGLANLREGGMARLSIFALGVNPVISAMLVLEFLKLLIHKLGDFARTPRGAARMQTIVLWIALIFAAFQAWGMGLAYEGLTGLVASPGAGFRWMVVATFIGATALLAWLASAITRYGVCNGLWFLFLAPTLASAPVVASGVFDLLRDGALSAGAIVLWMAFCVVAIAALAATSEKQADAPTRDAFADVWPALLASSISGFAIVVWHLAFAPEGTQLDAVPPQGGFGYALFLGALILFLHAMRRDPSAQTPRLWFAAFAQIFACVGAAALLRWLALPIAMNGELLILVVALAQSAAQRIALLR